VEFKDLKQLEKFINSQMKDVLETTVFEEVKSTMQSHIQSDVYEKYTPYSTDGSTPHYERTYELMNSIEKKMESDNVLVVENTRHEGNRDIVGVIEYGTGYQWGYKRNLDKEIGARPFVENTIEDLSDGVKLNNAMKKGLKAKGISVE